MRTDRRRVRALLLAVFIPVILLIGVLASAVLGSDGGQAATDDEFTLTVPPLPPRSAPTRGPDHLPRAAERVDVGRGAQGAAIFRPRGQSRKAGPVVIFLHGWAALDPARYGAWIGHLVDQGTAVIYPAYQVRPARNTITPLKDALSGVRKALAVVRLAPGRLVVVGHSAGGALAADYAAVAGSVGLPEPAGVFSVYPGRKLNYLPVPIPAADLSTISPRTRLIVLAGQRDTAVGSTTAREIAALAAQADVTLETVTDDAIDEHSAPRSTHPAARRAFWQTLDALIAATGPAGADAQLRIRGR